jgi:hypothetical protein
MMSPSAGTVVGSPPVKGNQEHAWLPPALAAADGEVSAVP